MNQVEIIEKFTEASKTLKKHGLILQGEGDYFKIIARHHANIVTATTEGEIKEVAIFITIDEALIYSKGFADGRSQDIEGGL